MFESVTELIYRESLVDIVRIEERLKQGEPPSLLVIEQSNKARQALNDADSHRNYDRQSISRDALNKVINELRTSKMNSKSEIIAFIMKGIENS